MLSLENLSSLSLKNQQPGAGLQPLLTFHLPACPQGNRLVTRVTKRFHYCPFFPSPHFFNPHSRTWFHCFQREGNSDRLPSQMRLDLGVEPATIQSVERRSNQLDHPSQGHSFIFEACRVPCWPYKANDLLLDYCSIENWWFIDNQLLFAPKIRSFNTKEALYFAHRFGAFGVTEALVTALRSSTAFRDNMGSFGPAEEESHCYCLVCKSCD